MVEPTIGIDKQVVGANRLPKWLEAIARIGTKMSLKTKEALKDLLVEHADVFVWSHVGNR